MEVITIAISLLLFLCLLGWGILLLVVGLQETGGMLRSLFVGRALLRAMRSPIRFRLRTMLLAAALVQALFAPSPGNSARVVRSRSWCCGWPASRSSCG